MILKNISGRQMFQKITPLIILALFAAGVYFMLKGMHNATRLADPQSAKKVEATE